MKRIIGLLVLVAGLFSASAATLSWNSNPEADIKSYNVYSSVNGGTLTKIGTVTSPSTTFSLTFTNGNSYLYRVTAVNSFLLESDFSESISHFQPLGVPPENTILTKNIADFQGGAWKNVTINWAAIDFAKYGVTKYTVNVKTVATGVTTKTDVTTTNFTIASLPLGDYEVYVTTTNSLGTSPLSATSVWTISGKRPNAPLGVKLN